MPDIFISYSRKDSDRVLPFGAQLTSDGFSVWIDQHAIEAARRWSGQTVRAIDESKVFILMLSKHSILSDQIVREVALAFEKHKCIVPIELEHVPIPDELQYQLAGIQRTPIDRYDTILKVLHKQCHAEKSESKEELPKLPPLPSDPLGRITFAVLPFENLSADAENEWFADGLTQELISVISKVEKLRVKDRKTVMEYKRSQKTVRRIAEELGVNFILEGSVRRHQNNLRIATELIDIRNDEHLWSHTFKGTIDDIFEIQERVAMEIAEALEIKLTKVEHAAVTKKITEDIEAYELFVRAREYFDQQTREGRDKAILLYEQAVQRDPNFVSALANIALCSLEIYRHYDRDRRHLTRATDAAGRIIAIDSSSYSAYIALSRIAYFDSNPDNALRLAQHALDLAPKDAQFNMGFILDVLGRHQEAVKWFEKELLQKPDSLDSLWNIVAQHDRLQNKPSRKKAAERALPYYERFVLTHPDFLTQRVQYVVLLSYAGNAERALQEAELLRTDQVLDAVSSFNLACYYAETPLRDICIQLLTQSFEAGLKNFLENIEDTSEFDAIREDPKFQALLKLAEESEHSRAIAT